MKMLVSGDKLHDNHSILLIDISTGSPKDFCLSSDSP